MQLTKAQWQAYSDGAVVRLREGDVWFLIIPMLGYDQHYQEVEWIGVRLRRFDLGELLNLIGQVRKSLETYGCGRPKPIRTVFHGCYFDDLRVMTSPLDEGELDNLLLDDPPTTDFRIDGLYVEINHWAHMDGPDGYEVEWDIGAKHGDGSITTPRVLERELREMLAELDSQCTTPPGPPQEAPPDPA